MIVRSQWIAYGVIHSSQGEDGEAGYRLEVSQSMYGDVAARASVSVEPGCLNRTVRFSFRSQREVVVFSLGGGSAVMGDDLVLPVVHDPINDERYIKIPAEFVKKTKLRESISQRFSVRSNVEESNPEPAFGSQFVLFEEFKTNLGDLCRDLK